ncbi:NADPH oxidoreductase, putative flavodoxin quinone reductase FqrB [Campylobacter avium LMG 24591]|uniref:NADPH oxidoreductase, putative flavodoxin quinone reductase FqrB n=1 Tax=Campylobacter avium LMG 24591 TaxID=522484 RepID=A0A222MVY0_9BACT|nr:NAD(P)-binding domain-containing protein [Campylobacter avium]ASQ30103.1 NADPH oxidoreductase, putative flavodoxin quinone reductase FqrB [Campylobacter avium LMG 24591]OYD79202.1 NADPH oxidoreductase, putative flavodoxin quinone reductase FqrB [Campylobacter avium]
MRRFDLIIIGAGPAGIGAGVEAKLKNKELLILEKADDICQTFLKFYKDGKRVDKEYKGHDSTNRGHVPFEDGTKESSLQTFRDAIKEHNLELEFNSEVESVKKNGEFFVVNTTKGSYECKNIVVAIGRMGKPNKPDYKIPSSLNKIINFNANSVLGNEKIIIVGGGNSAAEYAVDLCKNNDVTLCYRRDKFTRLNDTNLNDVNECNQNGKLKLKLGVDIQEIEDENSKAKIKFNDGSTESYDRVIYAIGGSTPVDFLQKCGIEVDDKGVPVFDENKQSNVKGIFVAGDIASKNGASIVVALNDGVIISTYLS